MPIIAPHGFPKDISITNIIDIARAIGHELLKKQSAVVAVAKGTQVASDDVWTKTKPDGSSLTSSDIWANSEIERRLKSLPLDFNNIGMITEEGDKSSNRKAAEKDAAFVIDPLDNTGDYKRGKDNWSVTIGFEEKGIPTGGVVYYPAQGKLYYTHEDGKSYCLDETLKTTTILTGACPKQPEESGTGDLQLRVVTDFNVAAQVKGPMPIVNEHAGHTDRYWLITLPNGMDMAEHGDLFYAWDIVGPAAIAARANVVYVNRDGTPLSFLEKHTGHNDFEMPRSGFIAGNKETLSNLGILKNTLG